MLNLMLQMFHFQKQEHGNYSDTAVCQCLLHCRLVPPLNPSFCLLPPDISYLLAPIQQLVVRSQDSTGSLKLRLVHAQLKWQPLIAIHETRKSFFLFSLLTLLAGFSDQAPSIRDNDRLHLAGSSNCEMIIHIQCGSITQICLHAALIRGHFADSGS